MDTDQKFNLSELKEVLHRLKYTVAGDDSVCYSIIHYMENSQDCTEPKKEKSHLPISILPAFFKSDGTNGSSQR